MTIDGQLAKAGWLVQLREEMNRSAGLGVAVREFPTASGPVDYALSLAEPWAAVTAGACDSGFHSSGIAVLG